MTKTFTLYWLDGSKNVVTGSDPAAAMNAAGFGAGSLRALDFYATGDNSDYQFNKDEHSWEWTQEYAAKVMRGA